MLGPVHIPEFSLPFSSNHVAMLGPVPIPDFHNWYVTEVVLQYLTLPYNIWRPIDCYLVSEHDLGDVPLIITKLKPPYKPEPSSLFTFKRDRS